MTDRQRIQQIEELLADLIRQGNRTEERVEMLYAELIALRDKIAENEERNVQNFGRLRQEFKADMAGVRDELKTDIAEVRLELKADIAEVHQELGGVRQELKADIAEVQQEVAGVKEELVGVRQEQTSQRVLLERILDRLQNQYLNPSRSQRPRNYSTHGQNPRTNLLRH